MHAPQIWTVSAWGSRQETGEGGGVDVDGDSGTIRAPSRKKPEEAPDDTRPDGYPMVGPVAKNRNKTAGMHCILFFLLLNTVVPSVELRTRSSSRPSCLHDT